METAVGKKNALKYLERVLDTCVKYLAQFRFFFWKITDYKIVIATLGFMRGGVFPTIYDTTRPPGSPYLR